MILSIGHTTHAVPAPNISNNYTKKKVKIYRGIFTSRASGRGNVFVVSVSVCVSVCVSVSVWAITFEQIDIETSFLVWCYILTISRSSLSIKVIESRSRSSHGKW